MTNCLFAYFYYFYSFRVFHISFSWWFFTEVWVTPSLLKSPRLFSVFWPISINNAVVYMVSTPPLTSMSSSLFINPSVTVPRAPITIDINVTFMFHSFFKSLQSRGTYPFYHFLWILLSDQQSPQFYKFFFFLVLLIIKRSGWLAEIRLSVCISKSQRSLCVSFSRTDVGLCMHH